MARLTADELILSTYPAGNKMTSISETCFWNAANLSRILPQDCMSFTEIPNLVLIRSQEDSVRLYVCLSVDRTLQ